MIFYFSHSFQHFNVTLFILMMRNELQYLRFLIYANNLSLNGLSLNKVSCTIEKRMVENTHNKFI